MKVTCSSIADFLENLSVAESVYRDTIRYEYTKLSQEDSPITKIMIQVSCIIDCEDGGQFLLEAGENCGKDYADGGGNYEASEKADDLLNLVRKVCEDRSFRLLPGVTSV